MELPENYKERVLDALFSQRKNFGGNDKAYAISMEINPSVYNRLKNGERDGLLANTKYLMIGRKLGVVNKKTPPMKIVQTEVFEQIREEIMFCKAHSKARIFVDNAGIGKTTTAKYLSKTEKNVFYIDCTQCKQENELIKAIARAVGVEIKGRFSDIKDTTKYYLQILEDPIVIIDEWGALRKEAFGLVHEYWNGTEGACGWYMIGGNAARQKLEKGVQADRDYFNEIFSRFGDKVSKIVPVEINEKHAFYQKLIADVIGANIKDKSKLNALVKQCLIKDKDGTISGLRRAETLLLLHDA